jgi:hypothetical protein
MIKSLPEDHDYGIIERKGGVDDWFLSIDSEGDRSGTRRQEASGFWLDLIVGEAGSVTSTEVGFGASSTGSEGSRAGALLRCCRMASSGAEDTSSGWTRREQPAPMGPLQPRPRVPLYGQRLALRGPSRRNAFLACCDSACHVKRASDGATPTSRRRRCLHHGVVRIFAQPSR